jgi:flagellar protein FliO/FliZ
MIMSLLIVLAIIAAIAWGIKRIGGISGMRGNSNTGIQIISAGSVGPRERVVLVEVAGQWLLLGVAQGNVNLLATLPPQQRTQTETNPAAASLTPKFAEWLQRALAARKER